MAQNWTQVFEKVKDFLIVSEIFCLISDNLGEIKASRWHEEVHSNLPKMEIARFMDDPKSAKKKQKIQVFVHIFIQSFE